MSRMRTLMALVSILLVTGAVSGTAEAVSASVNSTTPAVKASSLKAPPAGAIIVSNHTGSNSITGCRTPAYTTIQAAVNAASPGSKIYVCDGTYNESVTISTRLFLYGAEYGVGAPSRPAGDLETVIDGSGGIQYASGATTGTIDGFTLNGYTGSIAEIDAAGVGSAWKFIDNIIDVSNGGIYLNTDGITNPKVTSINENEFVQATPSAATSGDYGQAVLVWANTGNNVQITNNRFVNLSGPGAGINTTQAGNCGATPNTTDFGNNMKITGNSFDDNGMKFTNDSGTWYIDENFLALFCTTNATISDNTVTITDSDDPNAETPVYLGGGDWATTVSSNTLAGNGASDASGVNLNSDFYASGTGVEITGNKISGFLYGIHVRSGAYGTPAPAGNTPSYFTISSNKVTRSSEYGIAVDEGFYGTISGNKVSGSATDDCYDATGPGGPNTAGTWNKWSKNKGSTSSPAGLCTS
jgi:hypothetical protein